MKRIVLLLVLASLCAVVVGCRKDRTDGHIESITCNIAAITFEEAVIDYRDYTDAELLTVKNLLLERMTELGIQGLGISDDVVDITVSEVTDALETCLVMRSSPPTKAASSVSLSFPKG